MRRLLFAAIVLIPASPSPAAEPCVTLDNKAVAALFDDWNFALSSLDASQVTQRYWPDAVLLPTVSNTPRTNPAMISDYFGHFLVKRPRGHIDTRSVQGGCNLAVDMGTYTFSLMDDKGTTSEVAARYTFVYQYRAGTWKILHHHSSAMPERAASVADADTAKPDHAEAHAEPVKPLSRQERKAMRRAAAEPKAPAAKALEKPVAIPAAKSSPPAAAPVEAAPEQAQLAPNAKMPAEVHTAMFANLTVSPTPAKFYPPEAARRKERGGVNLKVCTNGEGVVFDSMEVLKSSGSKLLDEAAMSWARDVTWVPATYNRRRVEGCAKVDVWFEPPPELAHART